MVDGELGVVRQGPDWTLTVFFSSIDALSPGQMVDEGTLGSGRRRSG